MALTKNSQIDLNGNEMILDADADTSITASTDDQIDFKVGGSDTVHMGLTTYNSSDRIVLTNTSGNASMAIVAGTSGESSIFMADGTSGDASYRGYVQYQHTNDNFNIGTGGAQRLRIDSDGLKFGSDTAAANALDDYEEGTFTPTVKINSSTTGITGNFSGVYTKIGRQVTVVIIMGFTSKGSTTGNLSITVPFTSGDLSGIRMHGSLGYYNLSLSSGDHPRARLKSNVSEFQIHKTHEITPIADSNLANNTEIYITLTYFTA